MTAVPRILAFAGSARTDSFNKRLVRVAARGAEAAGVACTVLDLRDYPLPIYDGDLEAADGVPPVACTLRALFTEHQGLLIASPEYNSSISPLLKNTIDWISRSPDGSPGLRPFEDKVAALVSASPGALGGLRGLAIVRSLLGNIGVTVLPGQVAVGGAGSAFTDDGSLADAAMSERVQGVGGALARMLLTIHGR